MSPLAPALLAAALAALPALPALAQDSVRGQVVTPAERPVQGYPVVITRQGDGASFLAITDYGGWYRRDGLGQGRYTAKGATQSGPGETFVLSSGTHGTKELPRLVVQTGRQY
ncbi:Carboxypeptidase regulatory-like domain-containing protein [Rhodovulum sp. ES.010]|uniref:carboxypeptidase-like regulatory domain-containing protein n=1 Tax=Rhodovulum sp. ES.010 TaxID=1882821 RepID=UPI000929FF1E|nr:carboxypeptidase-like regulatory domain-containing protein [Rhodovulum sp. ES.010]SIO29535.1 Carboxypeptidase regulatory-like domain-containing protein [Rhodovulum sp. ES.010]